MEKGKRKHNFWAFSRAGTGTKQSGTGTISVLSTVLAITWSFLIRFK